MILKHVCLKSYSKKSILFILIELSFTHFFLYKELLIFALFSIMNHK